MIKPGKYLIKNPLTDDPLYVEAEVTEVNPSPNKGIEVRFKLPPDGGGSVVGTEEAVKDWGGFYELTEGTGLY